MYEELKADEIADRDDTNEREADMYRQIRLEDLAWDLRDE